MAKLPITVIAPFTLKIKTVARMENIKMEFAERNVYLKGWNYLDSQADRVFQSFMDILPRISNKLLWKKVPTIYLFFKPFAVWHIAKYKVPSLSSSSHLQLLYS